ncbi:FAD/NAD(P)-binding domain-containing protein [Lindgomyces ingoldianus]|uniref:FAD/NAD(P)-binding domain-containing protein n=1 Tax=Lindgomyces ingoldianus TaxID=673940 RepID=A0ACB6RGL1_9PLEO|nr:FAD/NAD(P)-binding domain-containing protein [Lindgomyces ingoldianus]KAF2477908.1 FAD/NAD(P)-binding domain-containing protein [Lindgomyces ingoldianus]
MATQHYDALVPGSGQASTPLASHLKGLGLSACPVQRSHIAGCCVNEGCTLTKTMVASGRVAYLARRARECGIHPGHGDIKVDMQKVRQRKRDIVTSFRGNSDRRLKDAGVDVLMGEANFTGENEVLIELSGGGEKKLSADKIYINLGCQPSRPNIPGLASLDQSRVLDFTSIQELGEVPGHLVILGGGHIGLEFGQLFRRLVAKATIIYRASKDPELPISISVTTNPKTTLSVRASHILATGRIPNTETLGLDMVGIKTTPLGHIITTPTLSTNVDGVFVLGDVKDGPAFTHISYDDFRIIRNNLTTQNYKTQGAVKTTNERATYIPSVEYTDPQFAHIEPKFGDLKTFAKGRNLGDETKRLLKAVVDEGTGQILSFSALRS